MLTETLKRKLNNGCELVINVLEPPLEEYAGEVGCWQLIKDDLFDGKMNPWLYTPFYIAEIEGETAGSMSCFVPKDSRDIGLVEFVRTEEKFRNMGVATLLLSALCENFLSEGGQALYLCTANPIAGQLYEKLGFRYTVGDGMRFLSPKFGDFDKAYADPTREAKIRAANWGDLPRLAALYNHPEPKWFLKEYLTRCFAGSRFERHFVELMRRVENNRGLYLVLETSESRVVGSVVAIKRDSFFEQHVVDLSFRVAPGFQKQSVDLLIAALDRSHDMGIKIFQTLIAECDTDQQKLVEDAGFLPEACLKNRLRSQDGSGWTDLVLYSKILEADPRPLRSKDEFYASRKPWQAERIQKLSE